MLKEPDGIHQTKFYKVVWRDSLHIRETEEINSAIKGSVTTRSVLEVQELKVTATGDQRARLADGRGWVRLEDEFGSVYLRECMRPFDALAAVRSRPGGWKS